LAIVSNVPRATFTLMPFSGSLHFDRLPNPAFVAACSNANFHSARSRFALCHPKLHYGA
jgi:hypothetical protein